jgi:hypothetical protein
MNTALALLLACALAGLFLTMKGRRAYILSIVGGALVAAAFYNFPSLM